MQKESSLRRLILVLTISNATFSIAFLGFHDRFCKINRTQNVFMSFLLVMDTIDLSLFGFGDQNFKKMWSIISASELLYHAIMPSLRHLGNSTFPLLVLLLISFVLKMNGKNTREILFRAKSWTSKISENSQENVLFHRHA